MWQQVAYLPVILLIVGSCVVWMQVAVRLHANQPLLPFRERKPLAWNPFAVSLALIWIVYQLILRVYVTIHSISAEPLLRWVQWACVENALLICWLLFLLSLTRGHRLADFGLDRQPAGRVLFDAALGLFACALPVAAVLLILHATEMRGPETRHTFLKLLENEPNAATVIWIAMAVLIMAPLTEELMYRVILQGWLLSRTSPGRAIGTAAVVFSAIHGWPDALPLLPLALTLGYVYYRRHSYWTIVLLHMMFNGVNLGLALLGEVIQTTEPNQAAWIDVPQLLLTVVSIF